MRIRSLSTGMAMVLAATAMAGAAPTSAGFPKELPVFDVTTVGLTTDQAAKLSDAFGVDAAFADGSVRYVSKAFNNVPMKPDRKIGKDEDGNRTVGLSFDMEAIRAIKPLSDEDAIGIVRRGFHQAEVEIPGDPDPIVGHTTLEFKPRRGKGFEAQIGTSVRFPLSLAGFPLVGPGANIGASLDPQGGITDLRESAFGVRQGETAEIIGPEVARAECALRYPRGSKIALSLLYYAPALSSEVKQIIPWYECRGAQPGGGKLVPALVPAIKGATPRVSIETIGTTVIGSRIKATVRISGGARPFHVQWLSTSGGLAAGQTHRRSVAYALPTGYRADTEDLMVLVTDANGLTGQARATLSVPTALRARGASSRPRTVAPSAVGVTDVGAEFNVTNWTCVQQSAAGFQSQFASRGIPIAFRWLAPNAWERDFRDTATKSGGDNSYVDNVDLAWYTGHGSPGSFTFDNAAHDDGDIVPSDARWGDRDLEWLQLESCNVLQFTDGSGTPIWSRWSQVFDGLHLLNGFQTTASCVEVGGGTAGEFSSWLLGKSFGFFTFPALPVRTAWAMMALSLEPAGKQYVTMGVYGSGGITDYNDYFWGLGPVGPDIPKSQITGYWWLMGQV